MEKLSSKRAVVTVTVVSRAKPFVVRVLSSSIYSQHGLDHTVSGRQTT